MKWSEVRKNYPNKWAVIEIKESHEENEMCYIDDFSLIDVFDKPSEAMGCADKMKKKASGYVTPLQTNLEKPEIEVIRDLRAF